MAQTIQRRSHSHWTQHEQRSCLDLNERCADRTQVCSQLVPQLRPLIDKARAAGVHRVHRFAERVAPDRRRCGLGLSVRDDEPVIYPGAAFDEFRDSELNDMLSERGIDTVVITGASSNMAVLYTGTGAAAAYGYRVVIPYMG